MKRINIILAVIALLLTVSCSRKVDFKHTTFITFEDVTYSISEGKGSVTVPVKLYNPTGKEVQITVVGIDGTGENGAVAETNYEIVSPAVGVLTFSGEHDTQNIEIDIIADPAQTGTKTFQVQINSVTDGVAVGGYNLATVKILDDQHPLAPFIGEWNGVLLCASTNTEVQTVINIESVESDATNTKLKLDSGIDPQFGKGSSVKYSAVVKGNQIQVGSEQLNGYENYYILGLTPEGYASDYFVFELASDGVLNLMNPYAVLAPGLGENGSDAAAEIYMGGAFVKK